MFPKQKLKVLLCVSDWWTVGRLKVRWLHYCKVTPAKIQMKNYEKECSKKWWNFKSLKVRLQVHKVHKGWCRWGLCQLVNLESSEKKANLTGRPRSATSLEESQGWTEVRRLTRGCLPRYQARIQIVFSSFVVNLFSNFKVKEEPAGVFKTRNNSRCNSVTVNTPLLQLLMNLL